MFGILDKLGVKRREEDGQQEQQQEGMQTPEQLNPYEMVDADSLVNHVEEEFTRRQKERMRFELQWRLNMAFIEGNQYIEVNDNAQTLQEIEKDYWWQQREVFNHIAPNIEARQARLGKMRPILKVRPGSNEQSDLRATKVSSQLLKNIYHEKKVRDKLHDLIRWIETQGTAFFKMYWNPNAGPMIPIHDEATGEVQEVREGDLEIILCPASEIFPDSVYNADVSDCHSMIHAKLYDIKTIKEIWGIDISPEESQAAALQRALTDIGMKEKAVGATNSLKNMAIVKEYHEMPSAEWPEGRFIVTAGKKLLDFSPLPYRIGPNGELGLPFAKACCITRPGVFWGKTVTERLIPIQRRYNALRNRKAEYLANCAIGGWIVEENSVNLKDLEANGGAPGYICLYRPGTNAPRRTENPPLPNAFETEEQSLLGEFSILSGVSEISRQSKAPPGVKSGVALSLALEQDETRLADTANNIEEFLIECGAMWLRLYKQFVEAPRVLRAVGKNNVVEVLDWQASDLKPEDVVMDSFSALSESPAQKRQMVFDLLGTGLFVNPDTGTVDRAARNRILDMLQFTDWEGIDDEDELHMAKADRENLFMAEGQFRVAHNYDNHMLHLLKHNDYRVSVDFEALEAEHPQIAEIFDAHVQMHLIYLFPPQDAGSETEEKEEES